MSADSAAPESVHLAFWPTYDEALIDEKVMADMRLAQKLVSLGHAARNSADLKVRQPLAEAVFVTRFSAERDTVKDLAGTIAEELNVKTVRVVESAEDMLTYSLNPLPQVLGRALKGDFPKVQKALREGDPDDVEGWAKALKAGENITVEVDGTSYTVTPEQCEVLESAAAGYAVAEDYGYVAALSTTLTDDLIQEGLAREFVRRVQTLRKDADFDISDHIAVTYQVNERWLAAIQAFNDYIRQETLADEMSAGAPGDGATSETFEIKATGETITISVRQL